MIASVVHPGVELDNQAVHPYRPEEASDLAGALSGMPGLVFEAHSTGCQSTPSLSRMVDYGFAVLKVGPGLSFAPREALYGLDAIASWVVPGWRDHPLSAGVEEEMLARPEHWEPYCPGGPDRQRLPRHFSYSDRVRYYWASPRLRQAVDSLLGRLGAEGVPATLVSQLLPEPCDRVAEGSLPATPRVLLVEAVRDELRRYSAACGARPGAGRGAGDRPSRTGRGERRRRSHPSP